MRLNYTALSTGKVESAMNQSNSFYQTKMSQMNTKFNCYRKEDMTACSVEIRPVNTSLLKYWL